MREVEAALDAIKPPARGADARALVAMMQRVNGEPPARIGFAARRAALTLHLTDGYELPSDMIAAIGPSKPGAGCLYLGSLAKVDAGGGRCRSIQRCWIKPWTAPLPTRTPAQAGVQARRGAPTRAAARDG